MKLICVTNIVIWFDKGFVLTKKVPVINEDINIDSLNDMNVHISADKRLDLIELDLSLPTDINAYELRLNNLEEAISGKKADGTLDYDTSGDSVKHLRFTELANE